MKMSIPISVAPPSHKDDGCDWGRPGFDEDLRDEIRTMARKGIPVTMGEGQLRYRNEAEGVEFASDIEALAKINQHRSNWVRDAFEIQIRIERILKAVSVLEVEEIGQTSDGIPRWRWKNRSFEAYGPRESLLGLWVTDGESQRDDHFVQEGPLTPGFLLDKMQKIENALTVQIKLKLFLKDHEIDAQAIDNHLVAGTCVVKVPLEGALDYQDPTKTYDAAARRIHKLIEEFETREVNAAHEEKPTDAMDSSSLNLI